MELLEYDAVGLLSCWSMTLLHYGAVVLWRLGLWSCWTMELEFDAAALWSCGTMELLGYDAVSMEFGTVELWD